MLKASFLLDLAFWSCKKCLNKKAMIDFEIFDSIEWKTNNYHIILLSIKRIKDNHVMKFGQLIKYSLRYIFL